MKSLGQLLIGLVTALGSSLLVIMAMSLALVEGGPMQQPTSVQTPSPTAAALILTPAGGVTLQPTPSLAASATQAQQAGVTACSYPKNWNPYEVQASDSLDAIAKQAGIPVEQLIESNCMVAPVLMPGTILYIPNTVQIETFIPIPVQATLQPCGPPAGWVIYTVRSGDTLFMLSLEVNASVAQLQIANCLSGTTIRSGTRLYVPYLPQRTVNTVPASTPTVAQFTPTDSPVVPTVTFVTGTLPVKPGPSTNTPIPTETAAPTHTVSPEPTIVANTPAATPTIDNTTLVPIETNAPTK